MVKKWHQVSLITVICILLNYGGKYLTSQIVVPLWLDSFGTALAAYLMGPVCGAIVGVSVNIMYGFRAPMSFLYALTNAAVGITIGFCAKKKMMNNLFSMITTCSLVTLAATVISVPLNCIYYNGVTGNVWGDGILEMLKGWQIHWLIAAITAEFFLDFLDKLVTLLALYLVICFYRKWKNRKAPEAAAALLALGFVLLAVPMQTEAAGIDYDSYIQTVYTNDSGLLSGEANNIVATDDGVLWIGTYAGLYRYSGNDFQYMNQFDSVKNVNCLYVDAEGRLWIGTNDDGLSTCIEESIANTLSEEHGLPSNSVRSIVQQSGGDYFVGTSSSLAIVRLSGGMKLQKCFPEITYASCLAADKDNHVAAVTAAGELYIIHGSDIQFPAETFAQTGFFTCCEFGEDGFLYVGTDSNHISVFDLSGSLPRLDRIIECEGLHNINSVKELENRTVFICADNGIAYIDPQTDTVKPLNTGFFRNSIDHMTVDYQGNLWFSSSRLGIMKMCDSAFTEIYKKANLDEKVVNTITKWNGDLYFGTDDGLDILDPNTNVIVENALSELLVHDRIRCLMVDSQNQLWICSYGNGIICVQPNGASHTFSSANGANGTKFRSCIELQDGTIAVSSDSGITFLKDLKVTGKIGAADGLSNTLVLCLLQCSDGTLLAGTDGGGIAVIRDGEMVDSLTRENGLGSGVILRMVQDKNADAVFIVTSNGICYLNEFGEISELDHFPYSNNYDIYDDGQGKLFVTGSAGIYIVGKEKLLSGQKPDAELLNYLSGLRGTFTANAWNYMDGDSFWYIAGNSGVTGLNISNYHSVKRSYRMLLKSVVLDDTVHYLKGERKITIGSGVSHLEFWPEIVNYSTDDPYICYYMDGWDAEKTVVRQSELTSIYYNNLPAGTYEFHLSIIDNAQKVIEDQVYPVTKEAEIYDNLWFKLAFILELILIVAWFTWFIVRLFVKRTIDLQKRELALVREQIHMGNETIVAIAKTVDAKDSNTSDHSVRVSQYSAKIAQRLGYSVEECENLRKAALLHDIGKIGIPDSVLNKNGKLDDSEYAIMKSHVTKGAEILKDFSLIPHVQEGAKYHHERYDGRGYTEGLKGEEIPEYARIIGISDAFDAMTANRVYRKKLPFSVVLDEIRKGRGTQFDPKMVDILLSLIEDGEIREEDIYGERGAEE